MSLPRALTLSLVLVGSAALAQSSPPLSTTPVHPSIVPGPSVTSPGTTPVNPGAPTMAGPAVQVPSRITAPDLSSAQPVLPGTPLQTTPVNPGSATVTGAPPTPAQVLSQQPNIALIVLPRDDIFGFGGRTGTSLLPLDPSGFVPAASLPPQVLDQIVRANVQTATSFVDANGNTVIVINPSAPTGQSAQTAQRGDLANVPSTVLVAPNAPRAAARLVVNPGVLQSSALIVPPVAATTVPGAQPTAERPASFFSPLGPFFATPNEGFVLPVPGTDTTGTIRNPNAAF